MRKQAVDLIARELLEKAETQRDKKLTPNQLALMSAILGVSNAGKDDLFRGHHPEYDVEKLRKHYGTPRHTLGTEEIAWDFCQGFAENEDMCLVFVNEALSWESKLKKMTVGQIKDTWSDYGAFIFCTE